MIHVQYFGIFLIYIFCKNINIHTPSHDHLHTNKMATSANTDQVSTKRFRVALALASCSVNI